MLMRQYTQADAACKDATRIFFGSPACVLRECRDVVMPAWVVAELIDQYNKWEGAQMTEHSSAPHVPLDDWTRQRILDLLRGTFVGEYAKWRDIGWGLKAGGFALSDYQYVTGGMMNSKSPSMAEQIWRDGKAGGKITMGTVVWFLKQRHGQDCLRNPAHVAVGTMFERTVLTRDIV
jgi:hypothetical protein